MKLFLYLVATALILPNLSAQDMAASDASVVFADSDTDKDGKISKPELTNHYANQLLRSYDANNNGTITKAELEGALKEQEKQGQVTKSQAKKVELQFEILDADKDGVVSRSELVAHLGSLGYAVLLPGYTPQTNIDQPIALQQMEDFHTAGGVPLLSIAF